MTRFEVCIENAEKFFALAETSYMGKIFDNWSWYWLMLAYSGM